MLHGSGPKVVPLVFQLSISSATMKVDVIYELFDFAYNGMILLIYIGIESCQSYATLTANQLAT